MSNNYSTVVLLLYYESKTVHLNLHSIHKLDFLAVNWIIRMKMVYIIL